MKKSQEAKDEMVGLLLAGHCQVRFSVDLLDEDKNESELDF